MPITTVSLSSDYSPCGPASSAGEEAGNDVLFATLFGAVVSSEDVENTDMNLEILPGVMLEEQPDTQEGDGKFAEALLFAGSEKQVAGSEKQVLDNASVSISPQPLNVDDESDAMPLIDSPVLFEEKEQADAGVLAADQIQTQAQAAIVRPLRVAGDRPLTTQLLTEIAEDLAPEYVVIKQKVSMTAGLTLEVDGAEMMPLQSDKALSIMTAPRQNLRTKFETSGPLFTETPKVDLDESSDEMIEVLALKSAKTASQAGLTLRPATLQLSTTETSTLLQSGIASQVNSSAGSQTAGGQTAGGQTGGGQPGLSSSMAENWLEMLDMQDENWAEQLVKRVERNLANAKEGIDFELNPRSLGKLHVNLTIQQNEAQLQMRTETSQAAQMITDAQSRLSTMLEDAGMKLAYLGTFTQSSGDGANGRQSGNAGNRHQNSDEDKGSESDLQQNNDATDASNSLVNVKA